MSPNGSIGPLARPSRILLIEDDEVDYLLVRKTLSRIPQAKYHLSWVRDVASARQLIDAREGQVYLVDYRLGADRGIDLIRDTLQAWPTAPMILLTGMGDPDVDAQAMEAGALDFLPKDGITPEILDRSIRYAYRSAQIREALQRERDLLQSVIDALPVEVFVKDDQLAYIVANRAHSERLGIGSAADVLGKASHDALPSDAASQATTEERLILETLQPIVNREERTISKDGNAKWLLTTKVPLKARDETVAGVIGIHHDITPNKLMESRVALNQKLESLGRMAAGIAHEINTPVQYVGDNLRFLQESFADLSAVLTKYRDLRQAAESSPVDPEMLREVDEVVLSHDLDYLRQEIPPAIEQSVNGLSRISDIVRSMKAFSHPDQQEKTLADLNEAVRTAATVSRNEWKYVAEIQLELDSNLPLVPCRLGAVNQVLLNLIVNAAHAIADKRGEATEITDLITISTRLGKSWVEICIRDTGSGIPEEIRSKVFDPFFTTKGVGQGTGQGLALAYDTMVKQHGGRIEFETEVGRGTAFVLGFPLPPQGDAK